MKPRTAPLYTFADLLRGALDRWIDIPEKQTIESYSNNNFTFELANIPENVNLKTFNSQLRHGRKYASYEFNSERIILVKWKVLKFTPIPANVSGNNRYHTGRFWSSAVNIYIRNE
jgi:hypothetical protein